MGEGLVGFGHPVRVLALLHRAAAEIRRIEQLVGELLLHGLAVAAAPAPAAAAPTPAAAAPVAEAAAAVPANALRSPMVGTAYLSGEPGADPFVKVGDKVKPGDTLLIIEAMKVMNPIAATAAGTVQQILIENAQPVEFDQPLIVVA